MLHTRPDYQKRIQDSENLIPMNEPVFLIRGQDRIGADAVRCYAALARATRAHGDVVHSAMRTAKMMDEWPTKHIPTAPRHPTSDAIKSAPQMPAAVDYATTQFSITAWGEEFTEKTPLENFFAALRRNGWSLAAANDYRQGNRNHVFFLFTKRNEAKYVKAEHPEDKVALSSCIAQASSMQITA